jgi:hypothetical protein
MYSNSFKRISKVKSVITKKILILMILLIVQNIYADDINESDDRPKFAILLNAAEFTYSSISAALLDSRYWIINPKFRMAITDRLGISISVFYRHSALTEFNFFGGGSDDWTSKENSLAIHAGPRISLSNKGLSGFYIIPDAGFVFSKGFLNDYDFTVFRATLGLEAGYSFTFKDHGLIMELGAGFRGAIRGSEDPDWCGLGRLLYFYTPVLVFNIGCCF